MERNDLKQLYENAGVSLPNENSLGKKIVPDDDPVKLQNFWNWFSNSKCVDEQGRPLVVYHGTPLNRKQRQNVSIRNIEGFGELKTINPPFEIFKGGAYSGLIFFTPDEVHAKYIADERSYHLPDDEFGNEMFTEEGYVYYVYLKTKKPFDTRHKNEVEKIINNLSDFKTFDFFGASDGFKIEKKEFLDIMNSKESWLVAEQPNFIKEIKKQGYDSLIAYDENSLYVAVFNSKQIKSVNNAGTFSSASNNIYEATAYHGTPHSFNEFSLKHISSGEGHQVHGWGLYFSLDKEIASNYRTILGTKKNNKLEDWQDKLLYEIRINGFVTVEFDLKYALKRAMESEDYPEKEADIELFKKQLAFAESLVNVNGTLFTVDVPENDVLLDEHASLSNQPSMVQQVIKESMVEIYGKYLKKFDYKIKEDIEDKICEYVDADDSLSKDDKWHINYIIQKMFSIDVISEEEPITPEELKDKWLKTIQTFVDSKKHVLDYVKERNDDEAIEKYSKDIMRAEYFRSLIPDIMKLITNQNGDLIFFKEDMKRFINEETGKTFYGHLAAYLEANMSMKTSQTISRYCLASMWLLKQGVQGIKYHGGLDGDCVVIFNPKRVKIISKE